MTHSYIVDTRCLAALSSRRGELAHVGSPHPQTAEPLHVEPRSGFRSGLNNGGSSRHCRGGKGKEPVDPLVSASHAYSRATTSTCPFKPQSGRLEHVVDNDGSNAQASRPHDAARTFGQIPNLLVPNDFDAPLPPSEVPAWEGAEDLTRPRSTYADRRPYVIVEDLRTLQGPTDCVVELPLRLDWSPKRHYDLADHGDRRTLYERTLTQALRTEDLQAFANRSLLLELWPRLWLPQQVRDLWEGRFPELAALRRTTK